MSEDDEMTKNVELSISGLQWDEKEEQGNIETVAEAAYFKKNGSHYLLYEEVLEGFDQTSKNRIKFKEHQMELTRQGLMNTHMVFEEEKTHMTDYRTPYGNFLLGINTEKITVEEKPGVICVTVEYKIEIGDEPISRNQIKIEIREKA